MSSAGEPPPPIVLPPRGSSLRSAPVPADAPRVPPANRVANTSSLDSLASDTFDAVLYIDPPEAHVAMLEASADDLSPESGGTPGPWGAGAHTDDEDADPALRSPEALEAQLRLKNELVVRSGYLLKKGEQRRTWKKRWFVLRSTKLAYYENDKEYQLLRSIDLRALTAIAEVRIKKPNVIGLVTPERTYYLQAATRSEMDDWLTALKVARREIRRSQLGASSLPAVQRAVSAPVSPVTPPSGHEHLSPDAQPAHVSEPAFPGSDLPPWQANAATRATSSSSLDARGRKVSFSEQPLQKALGALQSWSSAVGSTLSLHPSPPSSSAAQSSPVSLSVLPSPPLASQPGAGSPPSPLLAVPSSPELPSRTHGLSSDEEYIASDEDRPSPGRPSPPGRADSEDDIIVGPPLPGEDDGGVRYAGWLWKLGKSGSGWKRRWFVVRGGKVAAYKDEKEYQCLRIIPLSTVLSFLPPPGGDPLRLSKAHPHALKIVCPKRAWTLAADDPGELARAYRALAEAHRAVMEVRRAAERGGGQVGAQGRREVDVQLREVEGGKLVEVSVGTGKV